ncbi:MAG: alpha/beta hydrolase [Solirubrobacterales bacterium]
MGRDEETVAETASGPGAGRGGDPAAPGAGRGGDPADVGAGGGRDASDAGLTHREGTFAGAEDLEIYWQGWRAEAPARAVVVIAHGVSEHGGRYAHLAERLAVAGYPAWALDHRGHGRSEGRRAVIDRMDNAASDLDAFIGIAAAPDPEVPLVLLGHSMGGCLSLHYALGDPSRLDALVLSAPAATLRSASSAQRLAGRALSAIAPGFGVFEVDAELISSDPAAVEAYVADPLVHHGRLPARTVAEIAAAIEAFPDRLPTLALPLHGLHGSEDRLVPVEASRTVNRLAGSEDKTLDVYQGLRHEVFNERPEDRERVIGDLIAWLDARFAPAG